MLFSGGTPVKCDSCGGVLSQSGAPAMSNWDDTGLARSAIPYKAALDPPLS